MFPSDCLHALLRDRCDHGIAVALSGGVDSILLLTCLAEFRKSHPYPLRAITVRAPMTHPDEIRDARAAAESLNLPWQLLTLDPLTLPAVRHNLPDRCYHCKTLLFTAIKAAAAAAEINTVMDGTNASDSPAERPGMKALAELQIISPFARCGITKEMIRAEALRRHLPVAAKPANACLATRFPSGTLLTPAALERVAAAEALIRADLPAETAFRLRVWGEVGVLELNPEDFPRFDRTCDRWLRALRALGFRDLLLHPDGLQSGRITPPPALKERQ